MACSVAGRDQYGNPSSLSPALVLSYSSSSAPADIVEYVQVVEVVGQTGAFLSTFPAPLPASGNAAVSVTVQVTQGGQAIGGGSSSVVTVAPVPVSPVNSSVQCPSSATAGSTVTCTVYLRKTNGSSIGNSSLSASLVASVANLDSSPSLHFSFVGVGEFNASFTLLRASSRAQTVVSVTFPTPSGLQQLGAGPSLLEVSLLVMLW